MWNCPKAMQQVMAMQAEAIREKRARIIKAEAELEASVKLSAAAAQMTANPAALELRRMQMISEVGAENNSTTVLMIPSDFVSLAHTLNDYLAAAEDRETRRGIVTKSKTIWLLLAVGTWSAAAFSTQVRTALSISSARFWCAANGVP